MKRSQMLEIIQKEIYSEIYGLKNNDNIHEGYLNSHAEMAAEAVLDKIEEVGMLPPENGKEASYIVDYRFNCLKWDEE